LDGRNRHSNALKRSALCITHAGLNTTLEALTQGVPLVAIPVTNDQPGVAARIAYTKTGAFVPLKELTISRLTLLIDEVLQNPAYRDNANRLRQVITNTKGVEKAVDLLEEALGLVSCPQNTCYFGDRTLVLVSIADKQL
jgi:zeaxanthin glucosyltransferase